MSLLAVTVALAAATSSLSSDDLAPAASCERWALTGGEIRIAATAKEAGGGDGHGGGKDHGKDAFQTVDVLVIDGARIEAAGEKKLAKDLDKTCIVELPKDAVAMPGLHDGHVHLLGVGLRELTLNLEGTASIAELKKTIAAAAKNLDDGETLYGRGWIETGWPEGRMPVAADLDAVVSDRPVLLYRADGHAAVVNTAALEAAGIDAETPDPHGGRIERDDDGAATGLLIDGAMALVNGLVPTLDETRRREALMLGAESMAAKGWTSAHNMSVDPKDVDILRELNEEGELPIRVFNYLLPEALDQLVEEGTGCTQDSKVCVNGVKFYIDGALGSRGALLFHDYADDPGNKGLQLLEKEDALEAFKTAYDNGIQVATHAIGDKGNFFVLDWYKKTFSHLSSEQRKQLRWRIEHAQIVRPNDINRFAYYGIIPSMQPSHAIGDFFFAPDRLGENRLLGAYAWNRFMITGANVVGGSDAPVEKGDPRIEIFAATQRTALDGTQEETWHPEEALAPGDALRIFTSNAAFAVKADDRLGILEPGFLADISVFSGDPFHGEWDHTAPMMTVVGGKVVSHGTGEAATHGEAHRDEH